jgi:hypothetical protein
MLVGYFCMQIGILIGQILSVLTYKPRSNYLSRVDFKTMAFKLDEQILNDYLNQIAK